MHLRSYQSNFLKKCAGLRRRVGPGLSPGLRVALSALAACAVLLAACRAPAPPPAPAPSPFVRPLDGLMQRPALQRVVALQTARDAQGLAAVLRDTTASTRVLARAALAAGSVQAPALRPALTTLLDHPDARVRADAAFALGQLRLPRDRPLDAAPLLRRLRADAADSTVAAELLYALGRHGPPAALDSLLALDLPTRLDAALAMSLARYGLRGVAPPGALDRLLALAEDARPAVRLHATYVFSRVPPQAWGARADAVRAVLDAYAPGDPAAMHLLLGLARLHAPADTARAVRWLRDATDWRVRVHAARALTGRAAPSVQLPLADALDDASPHVQAAAAEALASLAWQPATVRAARAWLDAHPRDAYAAPRLLQGLARQGDAGAVFDALDRVVDAPRLRAAYLPALASLDTAAARTRLLEAARDTSARDTSARVAAAALEALATRWAAGDRADTTITQPYFDAFARGLARRDLATVYAAAPALADARFRPLGSLDALAATYDSLRAPGDVEAMTAVLRALGEALGEGAAPDDAGALRRLRTAAKHPMPAVRAAARAALARVTGSAPPTAAAAPAPPPAPALDWDALAALGPRPRLVLETARGTVTLTLDAEQAPLTVQTITGFAEAGRYDGVPFHRVLPNFVVQGGDFVRGDGFGGPDTLIRSELTRLRYGRGTLGMASAGKDTEGAQFFVTHSMQPHLDGRYTAFGAVTGGMDVVDRLVPGDRLTRARVEPTAP